MCAPFYTKDTRASSVIITAKEEPITDQQQQFSKVTMANDHFAYVKLLQNHHLRIDVLNSRDNAVNLRLL